VATDSFSKLEERIEKLLHVVAELRSENRRLSAQIDQRQTRIEELETERQKTASTIGTLKGASEERERKMHAAADKLEGVISRLESAG
jgi:TolA-binding protein